MTPSFMRSLGFWATGSTNFVFFGLVDKVGLVEGEEKLRSAGLSSRYSTGRYSGRLDDDTRGFTLEGVPSLDSFALSSCNGSVVIFGVSPVRSV